MQKLIGILFLFCASCAVVAGQFSSGSTGVDGALDLSAMSCPDNVCQVQLPESGIFNFTTINVPAGKYLIFKRNSRNTPATLLAQGSVVIGGGLYVSAPCGMELGSTVPCSGHTPSSSSVQTPGVGGFSGGAANSDGFGPGKGLASGNTNGRWVGPLNLSPIVGGSGGAGYTCGFPIYSCLGPGGGGAVVIASSSSITITGIVKANGGSQGSSGSGGAIRLVANSLNISGTLQAVGGANGVIRFESSNISFTGSATPLPIQATINPTIVPTAIPQLSISSVGGFSVPVNAGTRLDWIDVLLPNQLPDPLNVVVSAVNIPAGTQVQIGFVSGSPSGTSTPCNLAGTFEASSCTATISNLNRTGGTYLLATASFTPPSSVARFNPKGANQVVQVRVESTPGAAPKYIFLRADGSRVDSRLLSPKFLQEFGM